jgi:SNF2 family DNA or RNA helicase
MLFTIDQYSNTHVVIQPEPNLSNTDFGQLYNWANNFKERQWRHNSQVRGWVVPLNEETLQHISQYYIKGKDYKLTDDADMMFAVKILSRVVDESKAKKRWSYLFDDTDTSFQYPSVRTPFTHQRVAVEAMKDLAYFGLLMEMGTGKSKCVVDELEGYLRDTDSPIRAIIVCPKSLRQNWVREFEANVSDLHHMKTVVADGLLNSMDILVELIQSGAKLQVAIVSYDSVRGLREALTVFQPHYIAMDESHYVKNPESKRFKNLRELCKIIGMRRILTGSPVVNNILDLWSQFELLEPGILGFNSYAAFKREFCNISKVVAGTTGKEFEKIEGFRNLDKLKESMARVSFIVRKERCLSLPEQLYETVRVEMPANLRAMYDEFAANFSASLEGGLTLETDFIVVQMLKLRQLCCGFATAKRVAGNPGEEHVETVTTTIANGDAKLKQMVDDAIELSATSKLIIWANFHFDIDAITSSLNAAGVEAVAFDGRTPDDVRQQHVDRFNNDPKLRVFVAHPGAGGTGLTLLGDQREGFENDRCKNTFFYSNGFSFGQRDQAEARNHRIGQRNPVLYRDYVYEGTIEESVAAALQNKRDLATCVKDVSTIRELLKGNK